MKLAKAIEVEERSRRIVTQTEPTLEFEVGDTETEESGDGPERTAREVATETEAEAKCLDTVIAQHLGQAIHFADDEHLLTGDLGAELLGAALQFLGVGQPQLLLGRLEGLAPGTVRVQGVVGRPDDLPVLAIEFADPDASGLARFAFTYLQLDVGGVALLSLSWCLQRVFSLPCDRLSRIHAIAAKLVLEDDGKSEVEEERDIDVEKNILAAW